MLPAVIWDGDDRPHAPSVMGRLREKAAAIDDEDVVCQVVGLVLVQPDSRVIAIARRRKTYFDARSGQLWDLYFPGYYRFGIMPGGQELTDADDGPQFSAQAFDEMRRFLEQRSRWRYSGDCDLVLLNTYLARGQEPFVDWPSLLGGPLVDPNDLFLALSLGGVVEAISQAVERDFDSADWNVGDRLWPSGEQPSSRLLSFARDVLVNAAATVLATKLTSG